MFIKRNSSEILFRQSFSKYSKLQFFFPHNLVCKESKKKTINPGYYTCIKSDLKLLSNGNKENMQKRKRKHLKQRKQNKTHANRSIKVNK